MYDTFTDWRSTRDGTLFEVYFPKCVVYFEIHRYIGNQKTNLMQYPKVLEIL